LGIAQHENSIILKSNWSMSQLFFLLIPEMYSCNVHFQTSKTRSQGHPVYLV
jgi:hypothetical protein